MSRQSSRRSKRPEDREYHTLQPMLKKMPPNEIISEKYMSDEAATMKLVTNGDPRRHNINFIIPKTKDNELQTYASHFDQFDYLGHYCAPMINEVVYLKFNNTKYNSVPNTTHKMRVMPSFYVPFSQVYSEDQDYFTKHLGLKFPQTHEKALIPSAKYHKGCAFDPIFCSTFLNGNLFAAIRKAPYEYELFLQNDINSNLEVFWFNFSVQFYQVGYYTFRIKNITKDMTKVFQKGLKIKFLLHSAVSQEQRKDIGQDWSLAGQNIAFRKTNVEIQSRPGEFYYELYFEYRCKNKHDIGVFSLDVPYNPVDAERYWNNAIYKKVKGMTRIQKIQYGRTISGSPLNAYLIRKKKAGSETDQLSAQITQALFSIKNRRSVNLTPINKLLLPDEKNQRSIVIMTRMAGSDINGSHIMEGMVDYLLQTLDFESLKKQIRFYFIPMANVDSVKYGTSVCNLTGSNLINDWKDTHKIHQAQIHSLKEFLDGINSKYPVAAVINLSTQNEELFSSIVGAKNDGQDCQDCRIFPYVLSKRLKMFSFENSYFYERRASSHMCCHLAEMFPKTLAYQFNISRFDLARQPDDTIENIRIQDLEIRQATVEDYRLTGKEILANFLEHLKLFEKNVLLKERWTKEIQEMETKFTRKAPRLIIEKPAQERFTDKYCQIKHHKQAPSMTDIRGTQKSNKSEPKSNKFLELAKIFQIPFFNEINNTPKKVPKKVASRYLNNLNKSKDNSVVHTPTDKDQKEKENAENRDNSNRKNLFRIEEKRKSALGKAYAPSKLTFQFGTEALDKQNGQKSPPAEKQGYKKDISSKFLRKMKLEDAFKDRNGKSRFLSP